MSAEPAWSSLAAPRWRILVTGAAGFVGSHLTERLVEDGHTVIGVDNLTTGRLTNLATIFSAASFTFVEADVCSPVRVDAELDWILHLASPASPPRYMERPIETLRANAEGTYLLLELAKQKGAGFMLASTSEVYGSPAVHPQVESYWGNVNPIGPRSVYDEGKRYAEAMATAYQHTFNVPIRIARIFNTYGPRMDPHDGRVVSNLIAQALTDVPMTVYGDGSQTRSFQYVDDLVEGIVRLLRADTSRPVNLGHPVEFSVLELAQLISELTGTRSGIEFLALPEDDPIRRRPDITFATDLLGWQPAIPLREGLLRTIDSFRNNA